MSAKVAIVLAMGSFRPGGAERAVIRLANALAEKGEQVIIVVIDGNGELKKDVHPAVRIFSCNKRKTRLAYFELKSFLKSIPVRCLILSQTHVQILFLLVLRFNRLKIPVILNEHSMLSRNLPGSPIKKALLKFLAKTYFPKADKVIAVSKAVATDLIKEIPVLSSKVDVIPNAVIDKDFEFRKNEVVRHPFLEDKSVNSILLGAGRLTNSKRFDLLIKAFAALENKQDKRLIILGEGAERRALETLIHKLGLSEFVSLPGFFENPYPWMCRSRIFILASEYEGLPLVLIEALACGCRVISTNAPGGSSEILADGKYGILVEPGSKSELMAGIESALSEQPDHIGGPVDLSVYHADAVAEKYLTLIDRICNN